MKAGRGDQVDVVSWRIAGRGRQVDGKRCACMHTSDSNEMKLHTQWQVIAGRTVKKHWAYCVDIDNNKR